MGARVTGHEGIGLDPSHDHDRLAERAKAGGLGYGSIKQDLLARILEYFAPMRARREDYAKRPDDVEDILREGGARARELAAPVLARCRQASGFL